MALPDMDFPGALATVWVLVVIALAAPGAIAALASKGRDHGRAHLFAEIALLIVSALTAAGALVLAGFGGLGLSAPSWTTLPLAGALAAFFVFVWGPLLARLAPKLFDRGRARLAPLGRRQILVATLVGGVSEEVLYRLVGYGLMAHLTGAPAITGIVAVTVFALAHLPLWGLAASLSFLVPGAVLTIVYAVTGDLVALILAHVLTDALGLASRRSTAPDEPQG